MYLRDTDFRTLEDLVNDVTDRRLYARSAAVNVKVVLDGTEEADEAGQEIPDDDQGGIDPETRRRGIITVGQHEMPATRKGLAHLASFYGIPIKFLEKLPVDEQQFILDHRIQRSQVDRPVVVRYEEKIGISEVYNPTHTRVTQEMLLERLLDFLPAESQVVDWHDIQPEWWGSVIVPKDFDRGIGGDKKVGDLTYGGVRFGRNVKQNLSPWVQTYMFRLACTNGMEVPDYGLKVDARGMEDFEIAHSFGAEAKRAFDMVDKRIEAFYDLRSVPADEDRTGLFRRMAKDAGLPDRAVGRLEDTLPDALMAEDEVTLFPMTNHVTNMANAPGTRPSAMRSLQQAGGQFIHDHAMRCQSCHSRLS